MKPDPGMPGARRLGFWVLCQLNRHPIVWRGLGALLRHWPALSAALPFAARNRAVTGALRRTDSFLNTSHQPNLVAGDFLIGMNPDERYAFDRAMFLAMMPAREAVRERSAAEARRRIAAIRARGGASFDLVQDYLMWVVLEAALPAFGAAAEPIVAAGSGSSGKASDAAKLQYMLELRHVGAQLFAGGGAPAAVQARAEAAAVSLRRRIEAHREALEREPACAHALAGLARAPATVRTGAEGAVVRNGVGYAWVSHPVTVQAGALIVGELLRRPAVYAGLRRQAHALGERAWTDSAFHALLESHVLELMRFRPVFPVLGRDVPRATSFDAAPGHCPRVKAGGSLTMITVAAMFDPLVVPNSGEYDPGRAWPDRDEQALMFGYGDRRCPGRDRAIDILVGALIGVLSLPRLGRPRWPSPRRIAYDGPMVESMPLEFARAAAAVPAAAPA